MTIFLCYTLIVAKQKILFSITWIRKLLKLSDHSEQLNYHTSEGRRIQSKQFNKTLITLIDNDEENISKNNMGKIMYKNQKEKYSIRRFYIITNLFLLSMPVEAIDYLKNSAVYQLNFNKPAGFKANME